MAVPRAASDGSLPVHIGGEIVDTHVHASPIWYEPVETLLAQLERNGVARAVLIQQGGQFDNRYLLACVARYPDRLSAVVLVDTQQPDAGETLARWAEQGAIGVRLRAEERSPGDDPLAIWRQAAALGLTISCIGDAADLADPGFQAVVEAVAAVPLVIEHMGHMARPGGVSATAAQQEAILALAAYPHCMMKFHGLGEICARPMPFREFPFDRTNTDLFDRALGAFGTQRLMWGSDFPPVSGREGYTNALHWPLAHFAQQPDADLAALFGGNARRVFV